jgi:hypothetical protein
MKKTSIILAVVLGLFVLFTVAASATEQDEFLNKINGARYICNDVTPVQIIDIRDGMLIRSFASSAAFGPGKEAGRWKISGRTAGSDYELYVIMEDGETIKCVYPPGGEPQVMVFRRQR